MTPLTASLRIAAGVALLSSLYGVPILVGALTAAGRLQTCPNVGALTAAGRLQTCPNAAATPSGIVVRLGFVPNTIELEALQKFGRYGGSGGNLKNVVLLRVSGEDLAGLSRIYWIDGIASLAPCKS